MFVIIVLVVLVNVTLVRSRERGLRNALAR
jgi:hypothetical protein